MTNLQEHEINVVSYYLIDELFKAFSEHNIDGVVHLTTNYRRNSDDFNDNIRANIIYTYRRNSRFSPKSRFLSILILFIMMVNTARINPMKSIGWNSFNVESLSDL